MSQKSEDICYVRQHCPIELSGMMEIVYSFLTPSMIVKSSMCLLNISDVENTTEKLNFTFNLILINLKLYSTMGLGFVKVWIRKLSVYVPMVHDRWYF